jgi:AraC-like DNA-binding protein
LSAFNNKHYKMNFNDFINEYRVAYCKEKLLNGECKHKKLEAIAGESGFNNRNTFTSAFKRVTGMNPSDFLRNMKRA